MKQVRVVFLISFLLLSPGPVRGDGMETTSTRKSEPPQIGESSRLDKRLPPVVPGQKVNIKGHKMRVWSTSGPVPVSPAPRIPGKREGRSVRGVDGVSVIVDQRGEGAASPAPSARENTRDFTVGD